MKDLLVKPKIEDSELEAKITMAEEWNQFEVPQVNDERITELIYWNEEKEHKALLILIDEFEAEECYIRKCIWFSTSNYHYRKQEEAKGAFYQSGFCKESCVPRRFLK